MFSLPQKSSVCQKLWNQIMLEQAMAFCNAGGITDIS